MVSVVPLGTSDKHTRVIPAPFDKKTAHPLYRPTQRPPRFSLIWRRLI